MASTIRRIRLTYLTFNKVLDIDTRYETVERNDLTFTRTTQDGSRYKQKTGATIDFQYEAEYVTGEFFDIFNDAYLSNIAGNDVSLHFSNDNGVEEIYTVIVDKPQYQDDTVGTDGKVYRGFGVRLAGAIGQ